MNVVYLCPGGGCGAAWSGALRVHASVLAGQQLLMRTVAKSRRTGPPTRTIFSCRLMTEADGRDAGGSNRDLEDMFVRYPRGIDHKEEKVPPHRCQPTRSTIRQRGALSTIVEQLHAKLKRCQPPARCPIKSSTPTLTRPLRHHCFRVGTRLLLHDGCGKVDVIFRRVGSLRPHAKPTNQHPKPTPAGPFRQRGVWGRKEVPAQRQTDPISN